LYTDLLERAVNAIKSGQQLELDRPLEQGTEINLHTSALLPSTYLPDVHTRLIMYKRIANAPDVQSLDDIQVEMIDRFGLLPDSAKALIAITELKLKATKLSIRKIDFGESGGTILFDDQPNLDPQQLINLIQSKPSHYKLEGEKKLHLLSEIPEFSARCEFLERLLKGLM
ncbi:MAG: transcription-repair coupling factor, partial [Gammaproteobacteria bacterium]